MGGGLSLTRSGDVDTKKQQELINEYWRLKESIEDRTVKFLRSVDILESASIHILSCHGKTKDEDRITRKLLSTSKVLEEGERKHFIDGVVEFVEFVSQKVKQFQTDNSQHDVVCCIIQKYINKSTVEIEDGKDAGDLSEIVKDLKQRIKNLVEDNSNLRKDNGVLQHSVDSLEKSNEEYMKFKRSNEKNEKDRTIKFKNQEIEELKKNVEVLKKDEQLKQDDISHLNKKLKEHEQLIENLRSEHKKENEKRNDECNQYESKISQLSDEAAGMKNDIANLLKKHSKELDKMFDEKFVAELEWKELKDNVKNTLFIKCELEDQLNIFKINLNKCDREKLELQLAHDETCKKLHKSETKLKESEKNLKESEETLSQVFVDLGKHEKDNKELHTKLNQHIEMLKICDKDKKELDSKLKQSNERYEMIYKEKENTEKQFHSLQSKHSTLETELETIEKQRRNLEQDLQSCHSNIKILSANLEEKAHMEKQFHLLQSKHSKLEMDYRKKVTELETIEKQRRNLEQDLQSCHSNIKILSANLEEKAHMEKQFHLLQSKHSKLEMDYRKKEKELETIKKQQRNLEQDLQNCRSNNKTLSDELHAMKMKRVLKVNLFSVRRPNTLADFEDAVIAMLKSKIDDNDRELTLEQHNNPDDVNIDTDPTIVLCFCGSRIGTDAEKAVEGLNLSSKKALVMIHHKDVHALPQQLSERVLTGQEFKKLDFITDMAFLRDKGIFPCEINNNSLVKLVNFIKKKGKEYNKY
ncbi:hypothetical protein ACF0H5_002368 [Mactra antiquata]